MIYLNQAGTSWPKPEPVLAAAAAALADGPAAWPALFQRVHARLAAAFGISDRRRLLLTPGCTSAIGVAIRDLPWAPGDRIVISSLEHHALARPAAELAERGVEVVVVPRALDGPLDLKALACELARAPVRLVAMTAACNVTGEMLPTASVVRLSHEHGALCLLDGAQVCGWLSLDLEALEVDLFAFAAHKGLHAPWGLGGLYVAPHVPMHGPSAMCEISREGEAAACAPMPGYCDVGSVDLGALAGLEAALAWLDEPAQVHRLECARAQIEQITTALESLAGVRLLGVRDPEQRLPTVAFAVEGVPSGEVAATLRSAGVVVGSGLQCAPAAHEALGSAPAGAVRISVGPCLADQDVLRTIEILRTAATRRWRPA